MASSASRPGRNCWACNTVKAAIILLACIAVLFGLAACAAAAGVTLPASALFFLAAAFTSFALAALLSQLP